jgi:hypothetical protein
MHSGAAGMAGVRRVEGTTSVSEVMSVGSIFALTRQSPEGVLYHARSILLSSTPLLGTLSIKQP